MHHLVVRSSLRRFPQRIKSFQVIFETMAKASILCEDNSLSLREALWKPLETQKRSAQWRRSQETSEPATFHRSRSAEESAMSQGSGEGGTQALTVNPPPNSAVQNSTPSPDIVREAIIGNGSGNANEHHQGNLNGGGTNVGNVVAGEPPSPARQEMNKPRIPKLDLSKKGLGDGKGLTSGIGGPGAPAVPLIAKESLPPLPMLKRDSSTQSGKKY